MLRPIEFAKIGLLYFFNRYYFGGIVDDQVNLSEIGTIVQQYWNLIPTHFLFVELGEFVVMPNHIHGIIIINKQDDGRYNETPIVETPPSVIETRSGVEMPNLGVSTIPTNKIIPATEPIPAIPTNKIIPATEPIPAIPTNKIVTATEPIPAMPTNKIIPATEIIPESVPVNEIIPATTTEPIPTNRTAAASEKWNPGTLGVILNQYKRICTLHAREIHADYGWQSRFHDHIIRNDESFQRIYEYIRNNPLNWHNDKFFSDTYKLW